VSIFNPNADEHKYMYVCFGISGTQNMPREKNEVRIFPMFIRHYTASKCNTN